MKLTLEASEACMEYRKAEPVGPESVTLGPYPWVQITYDLVRYGPDGNFTEIEFYDGFWWFEGNAFSDIIIAE